MKMKMKNYDKNELIGIAGLLLNVFDKNKFNNLGALNCMAELIVMIFAPHVLKITKSIETAEEDFRLIINQIIEFSGDFFEEIIQRNQAQIKQVMEEIKNERTHYENTKH